MIEEPHAPGLVLNTVLRVANTIADLDYVGSMRAVRLSQAIQFLVLDNWSRQNAFQTHSPQANRQNITCTC